MPPRPSHWVSTYKPPEYYAAFRKKCINKGRCYKCRNKLYKWGLCKKHFKAQENRRKRIAESSRLSNPRENRCSLCWKKGHNRRTCRAKKKRNG